MKKLSLLLILILLLAGNTNAQKCIKADRNAICYSDTTRSNILGSIPQAKVITSQKTEGDFYKIWFRNTPGYVLKSDFSPLQTATKKINIKGKEIENQTKEEKILSCELARLMKYTKQKRRASYAMYASLGVGVVSAGSGIILRNTANKSGTPGILFIIAGTGALSTLISGICVLESQVKINKTTTKIQYLSNGFKVTF